MLSLTKVRTQQYAKSQLKWIRKQLLPVIKEARALGGEVEVYAVPGGPSGEQPASDILQGGCTYSSMGVQPTTHSTDPFSKLFYIGKVCRNGDPSRREKRWICLRRCMTRRRAQRSPTQLSKSVLPTVLRTMLNVDSGGRSLMQGKDVRSVQKMESHTLSLLDNGTSTSGLRRIKSELRRHPDTSSCPMGLTG
jgi:hypothetical protein